MDEHDRELVRLVKGSPQPGLSPAEIARQIGASEEEVRGRVERLVAAGRLQRDGERLIALDPPVSEAPPDRPIP